MTEPITFTVYGKCQPAGSKRSFVPLHRHTKQPFRNQQGGVVVSTVDANPKSKDWKAMVSHAAREAYAGPLLTGALRVSFRFVRMRAKGHYRSGKNAHLLKDDAPTAPITKPDVLKLARAAEDALTGIIWRDDAQIVCELLVKDYGEHERVEVSIESLAPNPESE